MMKKLGFLIVLLAALVACEKDLSDSMVVKGEIAGLKKGVLFLQKVQDSSLITIDSVNLRGDGNFQFIYDLESPELFYLYLEKADNNEVNDRITFFGERGEINITTNWNTIDTDTKITGSVSNKTFSDFNKMLSQFNKRELILAQSVMKVENENQQQKIDSVNELLNKNLLRRYQYVLNFALSNPDSYVAPYVALTEAADANPKYLDSIYKALPPEVATSKYGIRLKDYVAEINK